MAKAVSARQHGDIYQARAFWNKACRLFQPHSKVAKVGYEVEDIPHFDDVAVLYKPGVRDARGQALSADYYQIKWHTGQSDSLSCDSLTDPRFINSRTTSLLQRLKEAFDVATARNQNARFNFVTTWGVKSEDPMGGLASGMDGELRLDILFGATSGRFRRVRNMWADHLGVDLETLRSILSRLRLCTNSANLVRLSKDVADRMATVGFKPVEYGSRINWYDGLIIRLSSEGRTLFSEEEIRDICESEGLWNGTASQRDKIPTVGIRSFRRFTDHLEDETVQLLDLLHLFNGRQISSGCSWNGDVAPDVRRFVNDSLIPLDGCRIHLDCHGSIAFAAGYELDPKSGVSAAPIQRTANGRQIWTPDAVALHTDRGRWRQSEANLNSHSGERGVALSVTHSVSEDVSVFARKRLPQLGRILNLTVEPQVGPTSVQDGPHAWGLAEEVIRIIRSWSSHSDRAGPLHIFFAAPNGLAFFMGRLSRSLGPIALYEHDFESGTPGAYQASISLPISDS